VLGATEGFDVRKTKLKRIVGQGREEDEAQAYSGTRTSKGKSLK
jgi:hypothetical protein